MALRKRCSNSAFNKITISLTAPETILKTWRGLKPETIVHLQNQSVMVSSRSWFRSCYDYECACGKYKRIRYKGINDRCGVEVMKESTS